MDRFECPQGKDAALASIKKFKATVEDSINAFNLAKAKIDEVEDGREIVGENYTRAQEVMKEAEAVITKQYPLLVEQYENFMKVLFATEEEIKK